MVKSGVEKYFGNPSVRKAFFGKYFYFIFIERWIYAQIANSVIKITSIVQKKL